MGLKRSRLVLPRREYKILCQQVMIRDEWRCRNPMCRRRNGLHCHHIIFRSQGGDDADWNLVTLCFKCHDAVHDRWLVIKAADPDAEIVDANKRLLFEPINGWRPMKRMVA